jgi:TRAP-type uncharacterized transport system substrate-binding protein
MIPALNVLTTLGITIALASAVVAQPVGRAAPATNPPAGQMPLKERLNAWTVGIAAGLLEGAPIRFATEMARVVDDGENLHVLPVVTRGPSENLEGLLYLRGIDLAVINSDTLEEVRALIPDIDQKIRSVLNLFPSELHIFVGPDIGSLEDLAGKKVNFNTPGTAAAYTGPLVFERLKIDVAKTFLPHQVALEQLKSGSMAAVVFVTSKPVEAFTRTTWGPGFKFLPVKFEERFNDYYLPTKLTAQDYPLLINAGIEVQTIAVPTALAAFNWPKSSQRYHRVARFTEHLFSRIDKLRQPGFHPKWKEVNLHAGVPGLKRFPAAQEWLERADGGGAGPTTAGIIVDDALLRNQVRRAAPASRAEQERLIREFFEWQRQRR